MWYLAVPYEELRRKAARPAPPAGVVPEEEFEPWYRASLGAEANARARALLVFESLVFQAGLAVFCPALHGRLEWVLGGEDPASGIALGRIESALAAACDEGIIVCTMEGWDRGEEVAAAVARFRALGRCVLYVDAGAPGSLYPMYDRPPVPQAA